MFILFDNHFSIKITIMQVTVSFLLVIKCYIIVKVKPTASFYTVTALIAMEYLLRSSSAMMFLVAGHVIIVGFHGFLSVLQFVLPPHVQLKLPTQHVLVEMFVVDTSKSTFSGQSGIYSLLIYAGV